MSIEKDPDGHRIVRAEIEIQATPEAVWQAIATGPGIRSWFMGMESEFDEQVGGKVRTRMGDQFVEIAEITAWDPPRKFATRGENAFGPGTPTIAYEWTVEARGGGKCVLRLVQRLFVEDDSWDSQVGDTDQGWASFLHVLRNYVERHAGQPSGVVQAMGPVQGSKDEAFEHLTRALGLEDLTEGASVTCTAEGAPSFSGTVEEVVHGPADRVMLRLQQPFPGTGWIGVAPMSGRPTAVVSLYYYGQGAEEAGARDGARLAAWLEAHRQA